jgi:hypothetical protein
MNIAPGIDQKTWNGPGESVQNEIKHWNIEISSKIPVRTVYFAQNISEYSRNFTPWNLAIFQLFFPYRVHFPGGSVCSDHTHFEAHDAVL